MDDAVDLEIRRSVVLPRVTSAPDVELFSTAEVRPTAALQELPDPVVPEPGRTASLPVRRPRPGTCRTRRGAGAAVRASPCSARWSPPQSSCNTGTDWSGDTKTYAHVAAAQVRATCG